jgi:mRNA interferase RelE/StbE
LSIGEMLSPMLRRVAEYQVLLSRKAQSYYKRVDADTVQSLQDCFVALEQKPTDWQHPHIKRLRGRLSGLCRYRVGNLRVIYRIDEDAGMVNVVDIGPRGDIY